MFWAILKNHHVYNAIRILHHLTIISIRFVAKQRIYRDSGKACWIYFFKGVYMGL